MAIEIAGELVIPAMRDGHPVEEIGRKEFLSKKNLRKVTVPDCVKTVGDWAFAYCDNLDTVIFKGYPSFGKSVFLDCHHLRFLYVGEGREDVAALMAAAVTKAEAPYLLSAGDAGTDEWFRKWDARMQAIFRSPDEEGYSRQVLCGEEDYGSTDLVAYKNKRRRTKVRLALLRLIYPTVLDAAVKEELEQYLKDHTKGSESEETWEVVLEDSVEDSRFYKLFGELGCITEENFDGLLRDVGPDNPELKAWLLRYKEERLGHSDFFAELDL